MAACSLRYPNLPILEINRSMDGFSTVSLPAFSGQVYTFVSEIEHCLRTAYCRDILPLTQLRCSQCSTWPSWACPLRLSTPLLRACAGRHWLSRRTQQTRS